MASFTPYAKLQIMKKLLLLLLFPLYVFSQNGQKIIDDKIRLVENSLSPSVVYGDTIIKHKLEDRMRDTHIKGLSIAVIRNFKIEWAKGYGWADEGENRKVTITTRFQAASISKSLNSLGVLKLVEQGKLDPEADINKYLEGWQFPYDSLAANKKINTFNLLSHTAGLTIHGFPGYNRTDTIPTLQQILDGKHPANTKAVRSYTAPGKIFEYSGGGTTITQLLVTSITGRDYAAYMQEEVLKPLGMNNSSYRQPPTDSSTLATGYYKDGKPVKGKYHVYPEQAAAGLWTTPTDLARYIIECQLALEGKSNKVVSQAMMQKRMTSYIDSAVGLGLFLETRGGLKYFNHNGGNEAFLSTYYGSLKDGNGVAIMINGEDFTVINELLNSVAIVYDWKGFYTPNIKKLVTLSADSLPQFTGDYLLGKDTLTIISCKEGLCIQQNRDTTNQFKLYFSDHMIFSAKEVPNADFRAIRDAEGKIEALELTQNGRIRRLPRIH